MTTPLLACDMAAAAYDLALPPCIAEVTAGSDYVQIRADENTGTLSVCPAGSNDPQDWQSNRDRAMIPTYGGLGHRGLVAAWDGLAPQVYATIDEFPDYAIEIAGHSRGGGLGQHAAICIHNHTRRRIQHLWLIASMRAGDAFFCRSVERACRQITRYETRTFPIPFFRDGVPHLPHAARGYRQPGRPTYLFAIGTPPDQHSVATYRKALAKAARGNSASRR